jgi:hypothetical protein
MHQRYFWKVPKAFIWDASIPQAFVSFREFTKFCRSHGLILSGGFIPGTSPFLYLPQLKGTGKLQYC